MLLYYNLEPFINLVVYNFPLKKKNYGNVWVICISKCKIAPKYKTLLYKTLNTDSEVLVEYCIYSHFMLMSLQLIFLAAQLCLLSVFLINGILLLFLYSIICVIENLNLLEKRLSNDFAKKLSESLSTRFEVII